MAKKNTTPATRYTFEYLGVLLEAMQPVVEKIAAGWVGLNGGIVPTVARLPGGAIDLTQPDTAAYVAVKGGANVALIGPLPTGDRLAMDRHFRAGLTPHGMTVANTSRKTTPAAATGNYAIFLQNLAKAHPEAHAAILAGGGKVRKPAKPRKAKTPGTTPPAVQPPVQPPPVDNGPTDATDGIGEHDSNRDA
jgi:hypothetical protein